MCYFMCVSVPQPVDQFREAFGRPVEVASADETSIGRQTRCGDDRGCAYLLTVNGCSCDLFRGGHHMDARPDLVLSGIRGLLEQVDAVGVMVHWFTDFPDKQTVQTASRRELSVAGFEKALPVLDADTLYVVSR